ncbi:MAG: arsenite efflux transporter metallochaperone ArsD [Cyanobacteria bacterium SZAS LIN-3]|nr:arsenite efflux transporter metallochaperone ArsD [Cyanobacteria bacterium SZAS LIN-3]
MKIQVFEPPMCCSTGLCGPSVDPTLVAFSADLDWLKRHGIEVERYNLSQQTAAFVNNEVVRSLLGKEGNDCLPIILKDEEIASRGVYPDREALAKIAGVQFESTPSSLKFTVQAAGCCAPKSTEGEPEDKGKSCCS